MHQLRSHAVEIARFKPKIPAIPTYYDFFKCLVMTCCSWYFVDWWLSLPA